MQTKDFGLITTLTAKGYRYLDYQVDELGRIFFRFQDCPEVRAIEDGFFRNTVSVPVQDFINAQTQMKTLVFDIRRKDNTYGNRFTGSRTTTTRCA
jgi:hypothetical protein